MSKKTAQKATNFSNNDPIELIFTYFLLRRKKLLRIFQVSFVLLHIVGFIYGTNGKIKVYMQLAKFNSKIVSFVNCLSDTLLVSAIAYTLINLTHGQIILDLHNYAANKRFFIQQKTFVFRKSVKFMRVLNIVPIIVNIYFLGYLIGWKMYKYYLPRDVWHYNLNMIMSTFLCVAYKIKQNFAAINTRLIELNRTYVSSNTVPLLQKTNNVFILDFPMKTHTYIEGLKEIIEYHNDLCDLLDQFNKYAKPMLALLMMCNTVNIFYDLTILIEFGIKTRILNGIDIKGYIITIHALLIIVSVGQAALMAFVGENLEEEGQETTRICFSLLNKQPLHLKTESDLLIEKQLTFFMDQSKSRKVRLHAGGFFQLNWGILGSIASTVATYSIVIIQFLLK